MLTNENSLLFFGKTSTKLPLMLLKVEKPRSRYLSFVVFLCYLFPLYALPENNSVQNVVHTQ